VIPFDPLKIRRNARFRDAGQDLAASARYAAVRLPGTRVTGDGSRSATPPPLSTKAAKAAKAGSEWTFPAFTLMVSPAFNRV
jgi:hypothetical protein